MLESGKNENNSDTHTVTYNRIHNPATPDSPDASEFPDELFEELLRQDQQAILARSATMIPKPTTNPPTAAPRPSTPPSTGAPRPTVTHKTSMPLRLPSSIKTNNGVFSATPGGSTKNDVPPSPAFFSSGNAQEDLKRLEVELNRVREVKVKAEAEAKSQRVAVMALKTEVQMVRSVLSRRDTELSDLKGKKTEKEEREGHARAKGNTRKGCLSLLVDRPAVLFVLFVLGFQCLLVHFAPLCMYHDTMGSKKKGKNPTCSNTYRWDEQAILGV